MAGQPSGGFEYALFRLLERLAAGRSWERRGALGERLGGVWHWVDGRHRTIARENAALAFPAWSGAEVRALVRKNFAHLGAVGAEFLGLSSLSAAQLLTRSTFVGVEHLEAARAQGRGVFVLTAHQGNWELAGAAVTALAPPVSFVGRRLKNPGVDRRVTALREAFGGRAIGHRNAVRPILRALKEGRIVGMLMDHKPLRREAVKSMFFGRPVATNEGLAVLALKAGAPVVPGFGLRVPGGQVVRFHEPLVPPESGDFRERVARFTAQCDEAIEGVVRECPEQWFWVHRRWTLPEGLEG